MFTIISEYWRSTRAQKCDTKQQRNRRKNAAKCVRSVHTKEANG